jgi:recombination protein RecA
MTPSPASDHTTAVPVSASGAAPAPQDASSPLPLAQLISRLGIRKGPAGTPTSREWSLDALAGRFVELTSAGAGAALTAAVSLVLQSQLRGEPAVWISVGATTFYPPDVAASGVDLSALPVVRVDDTRAALRAADHLLRSGGFGVIVIDMGTDARVRMAAQSRLAGLARAHRTVLLCLTRKTGEAPSIGSLVSVRGEATSKKSAFDRFAWSVRVTKDKRRGPGWEHSGTCRGPEGLY